MCHGDHNYERNCNSIEREVDQEEIATWHASVERMKHERNVFRAHPDAGKLKTSDRDVCEDCKSIRNVIQKFENILVCLIHEITISTFKSLLGRMLK